jgi:hypothetical protein
VLPFDVLRCETVGAVHDKGSDLSSNELDGVESERGGVDVAGPEEPTDGRRVVPEGQDALGIVAWDEAFEPNAYGHPHKFEQVVKTSVPTQGGERWYSDSPTAAGEVVAAKAERARVREGETGGLPSGQPVHGNSLVGYGEETTPEGEVLQFVPAERYFLCLWLGIQQAGSQAVQEVAGERDHIGGVI